MSYFKITYSNGYCGCDEEEFITADSEEEAEEIAKIGVEEYGEDYEHTAQGCDFQRGWEDEEQKATYYENLEYSVEELTEREYIDQTGDGVEEDEDDGDVEDSGEEDEDEDEED